jgi:hypothetical protein
MLRQHDRQAGMEAWGGAVADSRVGVIGETLSRRERQVLGQMLQEGGAGATRMLSRGRLRAGVQLMGGLHQAGLVNSSAPLAAHENSAPEASWWWLTERGEQVARAVGLPVRSAAA